MNLLSARAKTRVGEYTHPAYKIVPRYCFHSRQAAMTHRHHHTLLTFAFLASFVGGISFTTAAPASAPAKQEQNPTSSPSEQKIANARLAIDKNPQAPDGYTALSLALIQRVRETGNPAPFTAANEAIQTALRLSPDDFEAQRTQIILLLGMREFQHAYDAAKKLNRRVPDDVMTYGLLAEAEAALGKYADAEHAVQLMLDLRPDEPDALLHAAMLREMFGDLDGARDMLQSAYRRISQPDKEHVALVLARIAHLNVLLGQVSTAEVVCTRALDELPNYPAALNVMAEIRLAQGRDEQAIALYRQINAMSPSPVSLLSLAHALQHAGKTRQAAETLTAFETESRKRIDLADNANADLIQYEATKNRNVEEAVVLARKELARRRDVRTLDAVAVAFCAAGNCSEAKPLITEALAVNPHDSACLFHAAQIAAGLGDAKAAESYYDAVIAGGRSSEFYAPAMDALRKLPSTNSSR